MGGPGLQMFKVNAAAGEVKLSGPQAACQEVFAVLARQRSLDAALVKLSESAVGYLTKRTKKNRVKLEAALDSAGKLQDDTTEEKKDEPESWDPVESSNLGRVKYDVATRVLLVEFSNRKVYAYADVPETVYRNLMKSMSPGSYFFREIRNTYKSSIVRPDVAGSTRS